MDTKALKEKIEIQKLYVADCKEDARASQVALELFNAELAEAEKPELRHGDYGVYSSGGYWIVLCRNNNLEVFGDHTGGGMAASRLPEDIILLGNIFNDLKAMSEDLTEFKTNRGVTWKIDDKGDLCYGKSGDLYGFVEKRNLSTFILKLRRLVATAVREKE